MIRSAFKLNFDDSLTGMEDPTVKVAFQTYFISWFIGKRLISAEAFSRRLTNSPVKVNRLQFSLFFYIIRIFLSG